jgi:SagB-type dehydrogenase family enzyme
MLKVELPEEVGFGGLSVAEAILKRRSERDFTGKPISLPELSRLLYYAYGITEKGEQLRAVPSAGALYPIEIYPVVNSVAGLNMGIYHYAPPGHSLTPIREGDFRRDMVRYALGQGMLADASVVLALSAVFERSRRKYIGRAYRYILIEAGHIAQNIYLVATSMGLGVCAVGAFNDDAFNRMLSLDGKEESVVYLMVAGRL